MSWNAEHGGKFGEEFFHVVSLMGCKGGVEEAFMPIIIK